MKNNNQQPRDTNSQSLWQEKTFKPQQGSLSEGQIYDVLIVGAGITGLTTGLLLQQQGKSVVIADAYTIGFGTTGGTSAHLNNFFDATYSEVESDFGLDNAKLLAKVGNESFAMIANFVKELNIDCDFEYKDAYLFAQDSQESKMLNEVMASSIKVGIEAGPADTNGINVPFQTSVIFKNQGQFHPLKYIYKLAEAFVAAGGVILENTFIRSTEFTDGVHNAITDELKIRAGSIVYATHLPPGINLLDFTCAPYRSYVIGVQLKDDNYPDCLSYDMKEPYHYFRSHETDGKKYLLVGGEDHKTGHEDPDAAFENLENYIREYYDVKSVDYKWSAQYYVPADGLPYIGQLPGGDDRIYIATGYNGNGMMFGTISGKILSDLITGKENEYAQLFSPSRIKPVAGFQDFVRENADVAYRFVADRVSAGDIASLKEIKAGTGAIVDYQNQKLAVYKDDEGGVHALSPVCTHAGCIVNFNHAEKSWDCPCHGGRFDINGSVMTGPPRMDLKKVDIQ